MENGVLLEAAVEQLEVEQHEHVADRGGQAGQEAVARLRIRQLDEALDRAVDLLDPTLDVGAQAIRILVEGFGDHLPVEEQMDSAFADVEQFLGVHERAYRPETGLG